MHCRVDAHSKILSIRIRNDRSVGSSALSVWADDHISMGPRSNRPRQRLLSVTVQSCRCVVHICCCWRAHFRAMIGQQLAVRAHSKGSLHLYCRHLPTWCAMAPHNRAVRVRPAKPARTHARVSAQMLRIVCLSLHVCVCLLKPASSLGPAIQVERLCEDKSTHDS